MLTGHLLYGTEQTNFTFLSMICSLLLGRWAIDHAKKHMDLRNRTQLDTRDSDASEADTLDAAAAGV